MIRTDVHITITPRMIKAGAEVVRESRDWVSDSDFIAEKVFKAMMEQIEGVRVDDSGK
jgi:hypothetical protein